MTRTGRTLVPVVLLTACGGLLAGCGGGGKPAGRPVASPSAPMNVVVSSPVVTDGGTIPRRFTCDGENVSLPLGFSGLPSGTAELALLMEDPDAPKRTFVHWVMWGIDPGRSTVSEGQVPPGAQQGRNDFDRKGYGGPCPPRDQDHRYVITAFAVSQPIDLREDASAPDLRRAVAGKLLAWGRLTAHYSR